MKAETAVVGLVALSCIAVVHGSSPEHNHLRHRLAEETLVTTSCSNLRLDPYRARLDLFYFYMIEYELGDIIDLSKFDTAIAHAISSELDFCDELDRPQFAVKLARNSHRFVSPSVFRDEQATGHCLAVDTQQDGTECKFIRGISSIFLDKDAGQAQEAGYAAIESVLNRTTFLSGLTGCKLVRSAFVGSIGENLVILSGDDDEDDPGQEDDDSNLPTIIAIAAALISFVLTVVFLYGLYRKHEAEMSGASVKARVAQMQAKRRHYFQTLEDDCHGLEPGWMTTEADIPPPLPNSSITWSVSDLTSDSQSIKSSLRMDRIEEEGPFDEHDDYDLDDTDNDDQECPSSSPGSPAEEEKVEIDLEFLGKFDFEAHFDDPASEASTTKACNHDEQALLQEAVETSMMTQEDDNIDGAGQAVEDSNCIINESEPSTPVRANSLHDCESATPVLHGCQFLLEDGSDEDDSLNTSSQSSGSPGDSSALMQMITPPKTAPNCSDTSSWSDFLTPQQEDEEEGSESKAETDAMTVVKPTSTLEKSFLSDWAVLSWWVNLVMDLDRSRRIPRLTYLRDDGRNTEG